MFRLIWDNPVARAVAGWVGGLTGLLVAVWWLRESAANDREAEVRAENRDKVKDQRIELEKSQNEQTKEADEIRRGVVPKPRVPAWMRRGAETDETGD